MKREIKATTKANDRPITTIKISKSMTIKIYHEDQQESDQEGSYNQGDQKDSEQEGPYNQDDRQESDQEGSYNPDD